MLRLLWHACSRLSLSAAASGGASGAGCCQLSQLQRSRGTGTRQGAGGEARACARRLLELGWQGPPLRTRPAGSQRRKLASLLACCQCRLPRRQGCGGATRKRGARPSSMGTQREGGAPFFSHFFCRRAQLAAEAVGLAMARSPLSLPP